MWHPFQCHTHLFSLNLGDGRWAHTHTADWVPSTIVQWRKMGGPVVGCWIGGPSLSFHTQSFINRTYWVLMVLLCRPLLATNTSCTEIIIISLYTWYTLYTNQVYFIFILFPPNVIIYCLFLSFFFQLKEPFGCENIRSTFFYQPTFALFLHFQNMWPINPILNLTLIWLVHRKVLLQWYCIPLYIAKK